MIRQIHKRLIIFPILALGGLGFGGVSNPDIKVIENGDISWSTLLTRIKASAKGGLSYPVSLRFFYDSGEFECEYQNTNEACKSERLIISISEKEIYGYSLAYITEAAYAWDIISTKANDDLVEVNLLKRNYSKRCRTWSELNIQILFDSATGKFNSQDSGGSSIMETECSFKSDLINKVDDHYQ